MKHINLKEIMIIADKSQEGRWGLGYSNFIGNPEICWPYLRFLYHFVEIYQPELVIECGVYMGTATEHMALASWATTVIGIDIKPHNAFYDVVRRNTNVRFVHGDSRFSFEDVKLLAEDRRLGLLFLDSTHDGETAQAELELYSELMDDECLVACDDIRGYDEMRDWWDDLDYPKIDLSRLHTQENELGVPTGFGVIIIRR
mgnify:CR=1 FL=1